MKLKSKKFSFIILLTIITFFSVFQSAKALNLNNKFIINNINKNNVVTKIKNDTTDGDTHTCNYETDYFDKDNKANIKVEFQGETIQSATIEYKNKTYDAKIKGEIKYTNQCPYISAYIGPTAKRIYSSQEDCQISIVLESNRIKCSPDLSDTNESTEEGKAQEGNNVQYKLSSSDSDSCTYQINQDPNDFMADELTFKVDDKNNITGSCQLSSYICRVNRPSYSYFTDSNQMFMCNPYIYITTNFKTNVGSTGGVSLQVDHTVVGIGSANDDSRDTGGNITGFFNPKKLCGDNNENCNVDITKFCTDKYVARTLKFLGLLLEVGKIVAVALIIIFGIVDLIKIIMAGKMDSVKKQGKNIVVRIFIGVIIFLLPSIIIGIYNGTNKILGDETTKTTVDENGNELDVPTDFANCVYCVLDPNNNKKCIINK